MSPILLRARGLRVVFDGPDRSVFEAVRGADWDIGTDEFVSIVGESGAGKSLSALALCGLAGPGARVSGSALYAEPGREAIELIGAAERTLRSVRGARIAYVFQDPVDALNPVLRCGEQVAEVWAAHSRRDPARARQEALRALARTGLPEPVRVYSAYPHELSGGMRQRVALAAALVTEPRLLIADEPTTALDAQSRSQVLDLIETIRRAGTGMSVLFITHDLGLARKHSDRIYVMQKGVVAEVLDRQTHTEPRTSYGRRLFAADPAAHRPLTRIPV